MKSKLKLALFGAVCALSMPIAAQAQWWNQHPKYLQALTQLRVAYQLVTHHGDGDPAQAVEENRAAGEIHAAYDELEHASITDGKGLDEPPPAGFMWDDHRGRLNQAAKMLYEARYKISSEEDNPAARGLRDRALHHIDGAIQLVSDAKHVWHF